MSKTTGRNLNSLPVISQQVVKVACVVVQMVFDTEDVASGLMVTLIT